MQIIHHNIDTLKKIEILSDAAKYDVSCSSSGSTRKNKKGGLGNAEKSGICHSWTQDGRCISLLKILMTNHCIFDCAYCVNRRSNDEAERVILSVEEIVSVTVNFYKRNYIEGLFLSSGVYQSPNITMEKMYQVAWKLRHEENFNGYIHMKAIPGASKEYIDRVGRLVDRMSNNIELPSEKSLNLLAPQKKKDLLFSPMKQIRNQLLETAEEKKLFRSAPDFVPAGQTTQMIIGATQESDRDILLLSASLYKKMNMKRVYFSAFVPTSENSLLPALKEPPLQREHRLYQADWLLRFYKFEAEELLSDDQPFFDVDLDPKCNWALKHIEQFPVEINRCSYEMLLRIPGFGVTGALKIYHARKYGTVEFHHLKQFGVAVNRAKFFITCNGKFNGHPSMNAFHIKHQMLAKRPKKTHPDQLSFLDYKGNLVNGVI